MTHFEARPQVVYRPSQRSLNVSLLELLCERKTITIHLFRLYAVVANVAENGLFRWKMETRACWEGRIRFSFPLPPPPTVSSLLRNRENFFPKITGTTSRRFVFLQILLWQQKSWMFSTLTTTSSQQTKLLWRVADFLYSLCLVCLRVACGRAAFCWRFPPGATVMGQVSQSFASTGGGTINNPNSEFGFRSTPKM